MAKKEINLQRMFCKLDKMTKNTAGQQEVIRKFKNIFKAYELEDFNSALQGFPARPVSPGTYAVLGGPLTPPPPPRTGA